MIIHIHNMLSSILFRSGRVLNTDIAALVLRIAFGAFMAWNWGSFKFMGLLFRGEGADFPDPLGVGGYVSMGLTVFAESICATLVFLGLFTRLALIPLLISTLIIAFKIHWNDTFDVKEHALHFFAGYLAIFLIGSGKYSLDYLFFKK